MPTVSLARDSASLRADIEKLEKYELRAQPRRASSAIRLLLPDI
jgi:hypothetical protein